jgi:hypothetical protein
LAHAGELNRRWGEDEVEERASVGEINFVVSRVEYLAEDTAQSGKNERNNSRELHLEVVWYGFNGYCLVVECFLFRSRKRKGVMIGDGKCREAKRNRD